MAKLVKRVLGDSQGKVGELVFKIYDGKVYISTHKGFNKISKSSGCVNNRKRFAVAIRFAKAANSLDNLKSVWKQSNAEGKRTYTKILRSNINKLINGKLSKLNSISPDGFNVDAKDLAFNKNSMSFLLKITELSNEYSNLTFNINFVIALYSHKKIDNLVFPYLCFQIGFVNDNTSGYKNVTVDFSDEQRSVLEMFDTAQVFLAMTKTDVLPFVNSSSVSFSECKI